jgi:hypothetical protein
LEDNKHSKKVEPFDSFEEALNIAQILNECKANWAFVGGIAVAVHGFIRATEDVDVVIAANDLEAIDHALKKSGYIINPEPLQFSDGFILHRRVLIRASFYFILDLLISPDQESIFENCLETTLMEKSVKVISKENLLKMKKSAGRVKDLLDIEALSGGENE